MNIITASESVDTAVRQVHLPFGALTRIKASRKWWTLPYTEKTDLPVTVQELVGAFEATIVGHDIF